MLCGLPATASIPASFLAITGIWPFGLFGLVNRVVDERITQLDKEAAIWEVLPEGAKEAVARRDAKSRDA